jgi:uncharacterized alkaline shock family protein YloU
MRFTTELGTVGIANSIIATIAGTTAAGCFGVRGLTAKSTLDGIVHLLKRDTISQGVTVTAAEDGGIILELHIAVDAGVNISAICSSIIHQLRYQVEHATGLKVADVKIFVEAVKA